MKWRAGWRRQQTQAERKDQAAKSRQRPERNTESGAITRDTYGTLISDRYLQYLSFSET